MMNAESRFSDREFDSREVSSGWTTLQRGPTASPSRGMTRRSCWPPSRTGSKCGARGASMMCSLEFLELPQTRRVRPTVKVLSGKNPVSSRKDVKYLWRFSSRKGRLYVCFALASQAERDDAYTLRFHVFLTLFRQSVS